MSVVSGRKAPVFFRDTRSTPPGGKYFYEAPGGEYVEAPHYCEIEAKVRPLLAKYGVTMSVENAIAEYMCPRLPTGAEWFCTGMFTTKQFVRAAEALKNSRGYCDRPLVAFDVLERRLRRCMECSKHEREWCPSCTGHFDRLHQGFRGRRARLPEDKASGVCACARAYEFAVAAVEYGKTEPVWEGAPETCWRNSDV